MPKFKEGEVFNPNERWPILSTINDNTKNINDILHPPYFLTHTLLQLDCSDSLKLFVSVSKRYGLDSPETLAKELNWDMDKTLLHIQKVKSILED